MAVVIARSGMEQAVVADLRDVGIQVAAIVAPEAVVKALGNKTVSGIETRDARHRCDLVVVCGHRIPDAGLLNQAGGCLRWDAAKGAFIPTDLPANISAVGEVTGATLTAPVTLPPERDPASKRAFVCLCNDVSSQDLSSAIDEGFDHIETLKRYTTTTMGPCQGRMCQLPAIGVCARQTSRTMAETGVTTSRPPNPGVTLGALAGARHHPPAARPCTMSTTRRARCGSDMGEWKRPRYYQSPKGATVCERSGPADQSALMELFLIHRPEDVAFIVRHFILLEERQVLLPKGLARMMSYLVPDVINHPFEL